MSAVVSVLGLIAVLAGIASFGFGLTIKEFSFGSTLMIAGMTALIGGLLLVALGAAIRELHRIGTILQSRQAPRASRPAEAYEPYASGLIHPAAPAPHVAPVPPPTMPEHDRPAVPAAAAAAATAAAVGAAHVAQANEPHPPEPHVPEPQEHEIVRYEAHRDVHEPAVPKHEASATVTHDTGTHEEPRRPLPRYLVPDREIVEPAAREPHVAETGKAFEPAPTESAPEQIPLWPHERTHGDRFAAADLARDPEEWEPVFGKDHAQTEEAPPPEQPAAEMDEPAARHDMPDDAAVAEPQSEKPTAEYGRLSSFDAIWPASERIPPRRYADVEMDAPDAAGSSDDEQAHRAAPEAPAIAPSDEPEPPHAVSILKSGTVDGMGYALYSDGSIEAELPSGKIRFASINELREHLEKAG